MRNQFIILSVTFLFLGVLGGCKSRQATVNLKDSAKEWEFSKAVSDVIETELQYETLFTKGHIELKQGKSGKKLAAHYKIIKDEIMQVSVRAPILGEVARINITLDSIVIMDRMRGCYASENFSDSEFMKTIDFNYYNLQALLTNKLFLPGKKEININDYSNFKLSSSQDILMLQTLGEPDLLYNFAVGTSEKILSILVAKKNFEGTLQFTYSDFVNEGGQIYPTVLDAAVKMPEYDMGFVISYSTLEIDQKDMKVDAAIPKKYEKISFSKLMEPYIKN